ncbi:hypothetical protein [Amycolatopsis sp. MJM2582]|uniref:hypothetical protein n=1 Tax=Amycolatopsis sp. MJM2582 TaxID=1427749 RepID=UPI000A81BBFC|nr:hypothetical protein [Amycolatopsis sp. MJM2582]
MSEHRKDEDDSGGLPPERGPGWPMKTNRNHVLIWVIQLLRALAAAVHEVSTLWDR